MVQLGFFLSCLVDCNRSDLCSRDASHSLLYPLASSRFHCLFFFVWKVDEVRRRISDATKGAAEIVEEE